MNLIHMTNMMSKSSFASVEQCEQSHYNNDYIQSNWIKFNDCIWFFNRSKHIYAHTVHNLWWCCFFSFLLFFQSLRFSFIFFFSPFGLLMKQTEIDLLFHGLLLITIIQLSTFALIEILSTSFPRCFSMKLFYSLKFHEHKSTNQRFYRLDVTSFRLVCLNITECLNLLNTSLWNIVCLCLYMLFSARHLSKLNRLHLLCFGSFMGLCIELAKTNDFDQLRRQTQIMNWFRERVLRELFLSP